MLIAFLGNLIAALAAGVAVMGETWDASRSGLAKLRPAGCVAVFLAVAGFTVASFGIWQDYRDNLERQRLAMEEVDQAWLHLISRFRLMLWGLDGSQSNPDADMVRRLLQNGAIERLDLIDLRGEAPHHHGPWMDNICGSTEKGRNELRRLQAIYVGVLENELIKAMKDVASAYAPEPMIGTAPCGGFSMNPEWPWQFQSISNHRHTTSYLEALLELRLGIDRFAPRTN